MNKHIFPFFAYLSISCFTVFGQPGPKKYIQFKRDAKYLKEDTNKVLYYLKFARSIESFLPDTALMITNTAKRLSIRINYNRGIEQAYLQEAIHAENKRDYFLAIRCYNQAAKIAELNNWYADLYVIYNSNLNAYYYLADYPDAMDIALKGLLLSEQLNDKEDQAHYYDQLGFIYQKQEKADESITNNSKYLVLANEIQNRMMIADAFNGLADGYLLKKEYKTSILYFFKALNLYNTMNHEERLDRSRSISRQERVAYTLFRISTAYKKAGNFKLALQYSLEIPDINKGGNFNTYDLASYYINKGDIYRSLKNYSQASLLLNKGLLLARNILHREDIRDAYEGLTKNFVLQSRYDSAYFYHLMFTGIKDSIINEKVSKEINKLEVERRDKEIALLNQQQKFKEAETARQDIKRNFIVEFVTLLAIILFLLLYINTRIRQQKLISEKLSALQIERQRISSDMHDDIGTGLSTMLLYINMMKLKLADSEDVLNIDRIATLGTALVEQMKEIVWSLSAGNDRLDSLLLFIRQYFVLLFEPLLYTTNIIFTTTIPDIDLENELRRNIFLCVKESLNNVIKHANATGVELNVQIIQNTLIILIKDNGKGLSTIPAGSPSGNGLKNIKRRMMAIKGKFEIFTSEGTVVRLELDLPPYLNG